MSRTVPVVLFTAWTLAAGAVHAASESATRWRFNVYLDGERIGYHTFTLAATPQGRQLTSEARFTVRLLKIPVYRYSHDAVELWDGACLQRIESSTDDNGDALTLEGRASGEQFLLSSAAGQQSLPGCVMSFAYWNPDILQADRLLNAQNGDYPAVQVTDLGSEPLQVADAQVNARRYRLTGEDLQIDLWYSDDWQWLALQSTTRSGDTLYYERQDSHAY